MSSEQEETRLEGWEGFPNAATSYAHGLLVRTPTLTQTAIALATREGASGLRDLFIDWHAALARGERRQDLDLNDLDESLLSNYLNDLSLVDWDSLAEFFQRFAD